MELAEEAASGSRLREPEGVGMEELGPDDVRTLELAVKLPIHRGMPLRGTRFVLNPQ